MHRLQKDNGKKRRGGLRLRGRGRGDTGLRKERRLGRRKLISLGNPNRSRIPDFPKKRLIRRDFTRSRGGDRFNRNTRSFEDRPHKFGRSNLERRDNFRQGDQGRPRGRGFGLSRRR